MTDSLETLAHAISDIGYWRWRAYWEEHWKLKGVDKPVPKDCAREATMPSKESLN